MFRQKPDLKFIRENHIAHQEILRPIIAGFCGLSSRGPRLQQKLRVQVIVETTESTSPPGRPEIEG